MEVALHRRLEGVAGIRISQADQTAEVTFAPGLGTFVAAEFRAAVKEADVDVLRFEIDACGRFEREKDTTWFVAAASRFVVAEGPPPVAGRTCLSADLEDKPPPGRLRRIRLRETGADH